MCFCKQCIIFFYVLIVELSREGSLNLVFQLLFGCKMHPTQVFLHFREKTIVIGCYARAIMQMCYNIPSKLVNEIDYDVDEVRTSVDLMQMHSAVRPFFKSL